MGKQNEQKKSNNKFGVSEFINDKTILAGIINALISVVLSFGFSSYNVHKLEVKQEEQLTIKDATILYTDIRSSLTIMDFQDDIGKNGIVFGDPITYFTGNQYMEYLSGLRGAINDKDFENIKTYLQNIILLENLRKEASEAKSVDSVGLKNDYFARFSATNIPYKQNMNGMKDSIEKLRLVSKLSLEGN